MEKKESRKRDAIESIISKPPMILKSGISQLRYQILVEGLTTNQDVSDHICLSICRLLIINIFDQQGTCPYRHYVWSVMLRCPPTKSQGYLSLVHRGPCAVYSKIRNDTFRTLTTDSQFRKKVSEESLIRLLNAFAWKIASSRGGDSDTYVQGMNVLAAPFLYVCKTESQAFYIFDTLLSRDCPMYIQPTLQGVHTGLSLVDICLEIIDPKLYTYLKSKYLTAELYAFASVLTLSACTPPLSEVLILWDFLFAYGVHMNILFVIAQLNLMREDILHASSPISLLRSFPPLNAKQVIKLGVSFVARLPDTVYNLLTRHTFDPTIPQLIAQYKR